MGGEVSKVIGKSNRTIPSNFLRRSLHDIRKRRRFSRPTKQSTPSKKELLSYFIEGDEESLEKREFTIKDMKKIEAYDDQERVAKLIEALVQEEDREEEGDVEDYENDDNNKDDQRMIRRSKVEEDGDVGPGSPSFRVFFTNNNNVEDIKKINEVTIGNKDVIKDRTPIAATNRPTTPVAAAIPSSKVVPVETKTNVKKETKRKSFRSVLPKNLLNVRSCCSAAHSRPERTHLLQGKAPV
ncbi:hypothetical protein P3S68_007118 [Capsicum galapagoense]